MEKPVRGAQKYFISGTPKNVSFLKGDVVVIPFPFADLTASKKRPALVLASLKGDDLILCSITSSRIDEYSVSLANNDFAKGELPLESFIRPNRLFTANKILLEKKIGSLKKKKIDDVIDKVCDILKK
jgi:mRNA interferase MazF